MGLRNARPLAIQGWMSRAIDIDVVSLFNEIKHEVMKTVQRTIRLYR